MQGRRRDDVLFGELPEDIEPGDYWKYVNGDGEPLHSDERENLTHTVWGVAAPNGAGIGTLTKHTVREHEDGTISVRAGDGSSNSILITSVGAAEGQERFHGYIEHGVWSAV